jgi:hypothetical protein
MFTMSGSSSPDPYPEALAASREVLTACTSAGAMTLPQQIADRRSVVHPGRAR